MGYYKELDIAQQADVDRIVQWYKAHAEVLPPYVLEWINERDERLWALIQRWEEQPAQPKPATEHVALQVETRKLRRQRERANKVIEMSSSDYRVLLGAVFAFGVTTISALVWVASVI
jgi:hypothetical protein